MLVFFRKNRIHHFHGFQVNKFITGFYFLSFGRINFLYGSRNKRKYFLGSAG